MSLIRKFLEEDIPMEALSDWSEKSEKDLLSNIFFDQDDIANEIFTEFDKPLSLAAKANQKGNLNDFYANIIQSLIEDDVPEIKKSRAFKFISVIELIRRGLD